MSDNIMESIAEELTCCVCLLVPRVGGLVPCANSHLVCEACFDRWEKNCCPTCIEPYQIPRPRCCPLAGKILDNLVFQCTYVLFSFALPFIGKNVLTPPSLLMSRFSGAGCGHSCKRSGLPLHERDCEFRPAAAAANDPEEGAYKERDSFEVFQELLRGMRERVDEMVRDFQEISQGMENRV